MLRHVHSLFESGWLGSTCEMCLVCTMIDECPCTNVHSVLLDIVLNSYILALIKHRKLNTPVTDIPSTKGHFNCLLTGLV